MKLAKPVGDKVVVEIIDGGGTSDNSGILLVNEKQAHSLQGQVVAVGPGARAPESGKLHGMQVQVGDQVLVQAHTGVDLFKDGKRYKIMKETDVLVVLEG